MHTKCAILIPMILSAAIHVTVVQRYLEIGTFHGKVCELVCAVWTHYLKLNEVMERKGLYGWQCVRLWPSLTLLPSELLDREQCLLASWMQMVQIKKTVPKLIFFGILCMYCTVKNSLMGTSLMFHLSGCCHISFINAWGWTQASDHCGLV